MDFVAGFVLLSFWEKVPRKIFQENPRQNHPDYKQQKSPTISCGGARPTTKLAELIPTAEIPRDARVCGEKSLANGNARFWCTQIQTAWQRLGLGVGPDIGLAHWQKQGGEKLPLNFSSYTP